jgi:hypothetical protein
VFANGDKYEGQWKNSLMDGEGKFTYGSGDVYTGNFSKGIK